MRGRSALSKWKSHSIRELSNNPQKVIDMLGDIGIKVELGKPAQQDPNYSALLTYDREKVKQKMAMK